jgi:phosphate acetyltransferase
MPSTDTASGEPALQPGNPVVSHLLDQLRRHPKRVVFTEGEDIRVIRAAARLVREQVVAPILLGNKERIRALAAEHGVPMNFILVIDPPAAADFKLFCGMMRNMDRYRDKQLGDPEELVARPHYFGALMVQYGQADAIVGGNRSFPAAYFRALLNMIKPLPEVPRIFGVSLLAGPNLAHLGNSGLLLLADTAMIPNPTVEELSSITIETGKLAHHFLGRRPAVALLSHSTKGSAATPDARRMAAAAALATQTANAKFLPVDIEGEVQADVALCPDIAREKLAHDGRRGTADVLVFPNLDAAHIAMKLLQHVAGALTYGQLILGLARPAAQVSRTATEETIFGTAAAVAVESIKYHQLYPQGDY